MNILSKIVLVLFITSFASDANCQAEKKYFSIRGNVAKLTSKLTDGLPEEERVLAIHEWITHNIKWKNKKVHNDSKKTVKKALRKRKGPANTYVVLFDEMCKFAEIETHIVNGNINPEFSSSYDSRAFEISRHTWNAVKINDEWNLVDVTFDAGKIVKKSYKLEKFIEKNIKIPYPGGVKHFYFIKKKSKFVHSPSQEFYLKKEGMLESHYPLMPMWQLTEDTISAEMYRKQSWEKRAHISSSTDEFEYDFKKEINDYVHARHREYVEGKEGNLHNDTNFVKLSFGEVKYVDKSIFLFKQYQVDDIAGIEERLLEIDSLFQLLDASKANAKKASQIEKKVFASNNKVHKARNKQVTKENGKRINKLGAFQEKTIQLSSQLKDENKRIEKKAEQQEKKIDKYGKWSPSFKDTKLVSQKVYNKTMRTLTTLFSNEPVIREKLDSLEMEFNNQLKLDFEALKTQIIDTCQKENGIGQVCKQIVEDYDHNQDSAYFSTRFNAGTTHTNHVLLTDSLLKKFIRLQKKTLSSYKKELSKINSIKKEAYTHLKTIYSNGGVQEMIDELSFLNDLYVERLSKLAEFQSQLKTRNESFLTWFKKYRTELKATNTTYQFELGKEKLRLRADLQYESQQYNLQLTKIKKIQQFGKQVKTQLKHEQKAYKVQLKELKKEKK